MKDIITGFVFGLLVSGLILLNFMVRHDPEKLFCTHIAQPPTKDK